MAKVKPKSKGGVNHSEADRRVHRVETCSGVTQTGARQYVETNHRPLNELVSRSSLATERQYNPKTGMIEDVPMSIERNASDHTNALKIDTVTSRRQREEGRDKTIERDGNTCPSPVYYGRREMGRGRGY